MPQIREDKKSVDERKLLAMVLFKWTQSWEYAYYCVLSWAKHFVTLYDWWNASMLRPAEMSSWKKSAPNARNSYHPWSSYIRFILRWFTLPGFWKNIVLHIDSFMVSCFMAPRLLFVFFLSIFPSLTSKVSLTVLMSLKQTLLSALHVFLQSISC